MLRTGTFLALALGASLAAASPAAAFNWLCIARDGNNVEYEGRSFGLASDWVKNRATEKAMQKCEAAGASCKLKECIDLDALYPKG